MSNSSQAHEEYTGMEDYVYVESSIPRITIAVFCETTHFANVLSDTIEDRRMIKTELSVHMGGIPSAIDFFSTNPTPNLLIIESQHTTGELFHELEGLAGVCDAETKVVIAGPNNDVNLYRELIKQGISEYVITPTSPIQIIEAISDIYREPGTKPVGRIVSFYSAVGGAGSSLIAQNAAWMAANHYNAPITYIDLDLHYGTGLLQFPTDTTQTIVDALSAPDRVDDTMLERISNKLSDKFRVLFSPSFIEEQYDFDLNAYEAVIETVRTSYENIVLDLPHTMNASIKKILFLSDDIFFVTTADLNGLRNVKSLIDAFRKMRPNDLPPKVIVNQYGRPRMQEITIKEFEDTLDLDVNYVIPYDPQNFNELRAQGLTLAELDINSKPTQVLDMVTKDLLVKYQSVRSKKPLTQEKSALSFIKKLISK
jgi:pilus assembly protein CpaE